jgi:hypothetical protein
MRCWASNSKSFGNQRPCVMSSCARVSINASPSIKSHHITTRTIKPHHPRWRQGLGCDVLGLPRPTFRCKRPQCHPHMLPKCVQSQCSYSQAFNEWSASSILWDPRPYEGQSDLVPSWNILHLERSYRDKQVRPPRVHKSHVSFKVSYI